LLFWSWEKPKLLASIKSQAGPIHQVSMNPDDNNQICVIGNGFARLYRFSEGQFKQLNYKIDPKVNIQKDLN
jgi:hypothetical protein